MSTTATRMREYIQAWDSHDVDTIVEFFAPDYQEEFREDGIRSICEDWFSAFPDLDHEINEIAAVEDTALTHLTLRGTHEGEFHGIPATGNTIEVADHAVARFDEEGRFVELNATADFRGLYEQLGVTMPPESTREERNKAVVREYFRALNDRDRAAFVATMAEDFTYGEIEGPEAMADSDWAWIEAMDLVFELDAVRADGDMVMTRGTARGTHTGEIMGLEPTGEDWAIDAMTWSHISDGVIDEWWGSWDFAHMLNQIGAIDSPVYSD